MPISLHTYLIFSSYFSSIYAYAFRYALQIFSWFLTSLFLPLYLHQTPSLLWYLHFILECLSFIASLFFFRFSSYLYLLSFLAFVGSLALGLPLRLVAWAWSSCILSASKFIWLNLNIITSRLLIMYRFMF